MTELEAIKEIQTYAATLTPEFGFPEALHALVELAMSAADRLTELEMASLLGAAGIFVGMAMREHPELAKAAGINFDTKH